MQVIMRYDSSTDRLIPPASIIGFDPDPEIPWMGLAVNRQSGSVEFSEERRRWEGDGLRKADREKLFAAGFRWDAKNQVLFAPDEDIALAGMEVL